jgi:copper resistance protein C
MRRSRLIASTGVLLGLLVGGPLVLGAPAAEAHDVLISTNPADGSTVDVVPAQIQMTFNNVAFAVGTQILVNGPNGNIANGPVHIVNHDVVQPVTSGSPAGSYTVLWRVTSADGHPVSGKFTFTATAASTKTASTTASAPTTPAPTTSSHHGWWWLVAVIVLAAGWIGGLSLIRARRRAPGASGSSG